MLTWGEFAKVAPEMAGFGEKRLEKRVFYLATIGPDSYPRVHPFTPFLGSGHLFAFMYPTSPKGKDLQRNHKYAMHSLVTDMNGSNGEFEIKGEAFLVTDPLTRSQAVASCPYTLQKPCVLFEFMIDKCMTNYYEGGKPNVKRWSGIQRYSSYPKQSDVTEQAC